MRKKFIDQEQGKENIKTAQEQEMEKENKE